MGLKFYTKVVIDDSFRDLFKRQRYEDAILPILNRSERLIPNLPLRHEKSQSKGESDYYDTEKSKYDIKLLLDKKQGALIGDRKNELEKWIRSMMDETAEFSKYITERDSNRGLDFVSTTKLYAIMKKIIEDFNVDETGIIYIPYPVATDYKESIYLQFATDFLQAVYDHLVKEDIVKCKSILFLYPTMEADILALRNAETRSREYIKAPEITEYIKYETLVCRE